MEIRKLEPKDTENFSKLIVNMYSNLENLEWFSPMPFDYENVLGMINSPRFYIIGGFVNDELVAVTCLDYKCGKLIGKVDFPSYVDTDKLVEIGFTIVHASHQGNGYAKVLVAHIMEYLKTTDYKWVFAKIHENNAPSNKSFLKLGFEKVMPLNKNVKLNEFLDMYNQPFFSPRGKENAKLTLQRVNFQEETFVVQYNILLKSI